MVVISSGFGIRVSIGLVLGLGLVVRYHVADRLLAAVVPTGIVLNTPQQISGVVIHRSNPIRRNRTHPKCYEPLLLLFIIHIQ